MIHHRPGQAEGLDPINTCPLSLLQAIKDASSWRNGALSQLSYGGSKVGDREPQPSYATVAGLTPVALDCKDCSTAWRGSGLTARFPRLVTGIPAWHGKCRSSCVGGFSIMLDGGRGGRAAVSTRMSRRSSPHPFGRDEVGENAKPPLSVRSPPHGSRTPIPNPRA